MFVCGPSGAGKDSGMALARDALAERGDITAGPTPLARLCAAIWRRWPVRRSSPMQSPIEDREGTGSTTASECKKPSRLDGFDWSER